MRRSKLSIVVAALALLTGAACGLVGGSGDPEPEAPGGLGVPTGDDGAVLERDPEHLVRVVNLHLTNGQPGAALDIYPATSADLARLGTRTEPIASGLGYGHATDPLQPGAVKSPVGNLAFGISVKPSSPSDSADLTADLDLSRESQPWRRAVVVLGGTGNGLSTRTLYDYSAPGQPNAIPASVAGQVSLMIDTDQAGDPNGANPVNGFLVAGTASGCLKATDDATSRTATAFTAHGSTAFVVVDPGTTSIGFWSAATLDVGVGDCSGAPAFSVSVPTLAAGSRAALFVFGTDAAHLAGVVASLDS